MNINKNNYEAFFLDYHEGNLSPHQVADLLLFIEQHPELKEEFKNFENIIIEDFSVIEFENKNSLKRELPAADWDELMIASVEGISTKDEHALLVQQLSVDTKLQQEFLRYQKTKLAPDVSIIFPNKNDLKRRERKVVPLYYYVAAAASVLLLAGLFFVFNSRPAGLPLADKGARREDPGVVVKANEEVRSQEPEVSSPKPEIRNYGGNGKAEQFAANNPVRTDVDPGGQPLTTINHQPSTSNQQPATNSQLLTDNQEPGVQPGGQAPENTEQPVIASVEKEKKIKESPGILSVMELATAKIKERTLDEATLDAEKKAGRLKKLSGWDLAQLAAKGFNKLTGRKVEVKPTYNDQGDVIAYSLSAGEFQISRGR